MNRKLIMMLLSGAICLLGATAVLAENVERYELKEYEELIGKKLKFNESPMLRTRVAAGELPPVEERIPEEPLIIRPREEIGQYGGRIRVVSPELDEAVIESVIVRGIATLLALSLDGTTVVPNIAKGWEESEDGKTLTLYLRKGVKWSDGAPFTADDIMFWCEDVLLNDELTPVQPADLSPGGEVMRVEKIGDYTVRFHFAAPYSSVMARMFGLPSRSFYAPKHYLMQFHPRYTPIEELEKMAQMEGYEYWYQLFARQNKDVYMGVGYPPVKFPTLNAFWTIERKLDVALAERNPYYWVVDTAGNQLPYVDEILATAVMDAQTRSAKILAGEVDFAGVTPSAADITLYKENAEKGDYRVLLWGSAFANEAAYMPNQTVKDPVLRKIFGDIRFRQALSLAINREEINQVVFLGLGVPRQVTVFPASKHYEEKFAKAYTEYNPKEANRLLDEMGLIWDKDQKWRLQPDGRKLAIVCHYVEAEAPVEAVSELVEHYWEAIGIDLALKRATWTDMGALMAANGLEMSSFYAWAMDPAEYEIGTGGMPVKMGYGWGLDWWTWLVSEGKEGEEPPTEVRRIYQSWLKQKTAANEKEKASLIKDILQLNAENLWVIGTVGMGPRPIIVKNNLRNVPEKFAGWSQVASRRFNPEQYFFKKE